MQQNLKGLSEVGAQIPMPQVDPVSAGAKTWLHLMSEWTRETAYFVGVRLERHADFQMGLARCSSPFEPLQCMMEFNNKAVEDYSAQIQRTASLVARESETAIVDMAAQLDLYKAPVVE